MASPHRQKRVLVSWYTTPQYIPPFALSDRQVTVGPQAEPDQPKMMFAGWTPAGEYDLTAALESQKIATQFDAVVVWSDASGSNRPLNLAAFDCPKVLCLGDTQHQERPIRRMIDYARRAGFDFIVSSHNRQHLHWFGEAGFDKLAWIPGLKARHMPRPIKDGRAPQVCFIGQWTDFHPRRRRLLAALQDQGVSLLARQATREVSADLYAGSVTSLNASLNGDLNLRVFEVLSAGGCLLTDRLSPQSGLDRILQEDRDFCAYGSPEELVDKARFLLREPAAALALARAGNRTYTNTLLPEWQMEALLKWVFDGQLDETYAVHAAPATPGPLSLMTRIALYETLQEVHRRREAPRVFVARDLPAIIQEDCADLHRMTLVTGDSREPPSGQSWDCAVVPKGTALAPALQSLPLISL
jgi:hypothetical protein